MRAFVIKDSPIGPLTLYFKPEGLTRLDFGDTYDSDRDDAADGSEPSLAEAVRILEAYFRGETVDFRQTALKLCPEGTPFQQSVWNVISEISYGEVLTYAALAQRLDKPKASRAVGGATGRNPIPILIPCHRVIGSNRQLTGFSAPGGLETKKQLLTLEHFSDFKEKTK
jgi:methylated-DNA-[protein]-cysteine S-methyltransferase